VLLAVAGGRELVAPLGEPHMAPKKRPPTMASKPPFA
jgi:hypothetical protein